MFAKLSKEEQFVRNSVVVKHSLRQKFFSPWISLSHTCINNFINYALFTACFQMQQLALQQNLQMEMTPLNMYNMFIERIRRNLHVVLAFSPIGDNFRNRIRMFPSLINCCTIDWFKVRLVEVYFKEGLMVVFIYRLIELSEKKSSL